MVPIEPTTTNKIKIDEDEYFEFIFKAGSVVIPNTDLVKTSKITYPDTKLSLHIYILILIKFIFWRKNENYHSQRDK
jgi:hypothetical protein